MLDGKILAAVLATLTALAAGTGGGEVPNQSQVEMPSEIGLGSITDSLETARNIFGSKPEPETEVEANLVVGSLYDKKLKIGSADLSPGVQELDAGKQTIDSDDSIDLYGFSGTLGFGNKSSFQGSVKRIETSGIDIRGETTVTHKFDKNRIVLRNVSDTALNFKDVRGKISSGDAEASFGNSTRALDINSYSGTMVFYPSNKTVSLDGEVGRLKYGSFKFGG